MTDTPLEKATPQQRRILDAWYRLGSQKAAANDLRISKKTVTNHMTALYRRTGARGELDVFYWLGIEKARIGVSSRIRGARSQAVD